MVLGSSPLGGWCSAEHTVGLPSALRCWTHDAPSQLDWCGSCPALQGRCPPSPGATEARGPGPAPRAGVCHHRNCPTPPEGGAAPPSCSQASKSGGPRLGGGRGAALAEDSGGSCGAGRRRLRSRAAAQASPQWVTRGGVSRPLRLAWVGPCWAVSVHSPSKAQHAVGPQGERAEWVSFLR